MNRVLVTGWSGFIGHHLLGQLGSYKIRLAGRSTRNPFPDSGYEFSSLDLDSMHNNLDKLMDGVDVVVHLAGIAHRNSVATAEYEQHVRTTARLATAAVKLGVKRFIYLSTIKVHGETSPIDGAITESSPLSPADPYSISKLKAESAIVTACQGSGMEYVILRPPLVYGPGVKANFLNLLQMISWQLPLPFAGINNQRSLIYVENLCALIRSCIDHPAAGNQVYVVKDFDDSTGGLITRLAQAGGYRPWLIKVSPTILKWTARLFRVKNKMDRLTESLLVDNSKVVRQLAWTAPIDTETAMRNTAVWFMNRDV